MSITPGMLVVAAAALTAPPAIAQGDNSGQLFAPPQKISAGEAVAGKGRLYPSPAMHDVDGDGLADLVIGDLMGKVTYARRLPGDGLSFAAEQPVLDRDGEKLNFHNW